MLLSQLVRICLIGAALVLSGTAASQQNFPNKPIRLITTAAGGGSDFNARLLAQAISPGLGQQVIVDNRASNIIAADIVSKGVPDGYTLTFGGSSIWTYGLLRKAPYDPVKDLAPVVAVSRDILILVVHPSVPVNSVKDLIALAKAKPGVLNYATGEVGSPPHLSAELFKSMAGVDIVRVNYKGTGPVINDMLGGQVQLTFSPTAPIMPHVKSGKLKALAVTSATPSALAPGIPTIAASGLPGYEATQTYGLFAAPKTPTAIITKLSQTSLRALNSPETKEKFLTGGTEIIASSPQELSNIVKTDVVKWGKVIKDAKITVE